MTNETELPSLQALMELISGLQRTIVLLTAKLEAYEKRDQEKSEKKREEEVGQSEKNDSSNGTGQGFSVNFGNFGNSAGMNFGLNQGQSYRSALLSAEQSAESTNANQVNSKGPQKLKVPQPGSIQASSRLNARYDPVKDRTNVAFYKQSQSSTQAGNGSNRNDEIESRRNKRQLSPSGDDESGWSVATGTKRRGQNKNGQKSTVTPLVIRHKSTLNVNKETSKVKSVQYENESDEENGMELDENSSEEENSAAVRGNTAFQNTFRNEAVTETDSIVAVVPPSPIQLGNRSIFLTERPEGGMRDVITVECQKINGEDFRGTITYTEATLKIFQNKLGLPNDILHSVKMSFSKCRLVSFKLKKQVNIDEMLDRENFELERSYMQDNLIKTDTITCKILGIRKPRTTPDYPRPQFDGTENDVQWVEISGCQYSITEGELRCWLGIYGEIQSSITEMTHPDSDPNNPIGNGTYVVKMKLWKPIPQFLPISGRKIRFYYNGIRRECTNCYGNHGKQNCRSKKVNWIEQVRNYMKINPSINKLWYGKWWPIIHKSGQGEMNNRSRSRQSRTWRFGNNEWNHQRPNSSRGDMDGRYHVNQESSRSRQRRGSNSRSRAGRYESTSRPYLNHQSNHTNHLNDEIRNQGRARTRSPPRSSRHPSKKNDEITNGKQIENQLKKIRQRQDVEKEVETYIAQGLSKSDAIAYIECLKTQEVLCKRMKKTHNQTENGE